MLDFFAVVGVIVTVFGGLWLVGQWMNRQPERRQASVDEWIGRVGLVAMAAGLASVVLPAIF